jgi:F0F1-type ATP synthase assembly protein I
MQTDLKKGLIGLEKLSLGISMVVAVLIGVGVGLGLKALFGQPWWLWVGVFWGVMAAGLNVYKAYRSLQAEFEEERLKRENIKPAYDDEDDDD